MSTFLQFLSLEPNGIFDSCRIIATVKTHFHFYNSKNNEIDIRKEEEAFTGHYNLYIAQDHTPACGGGKGTLC